jgi:hypothetical protein
MFVCFTLLSSVINLIYSKQFQFFYNFFSSKFQNLSNFHLSLRLFLVGLSSFSGVKGSPDFSVTRKKHDLSYQKVIHDGGGGVLR